MAQNIVNGLVFGGSVSFDPSQPGIAADGSVKVAQQTTLLDGKILNADEAYIWQTVGNGTGTFTGNKFNMSVTAGQWLVRQTRRRYPYFSGKPQKVEETMDNFAPDANVVKRYGYFSSNAVSPYDSDYDGFWLESGSGTIAVKMARLGTSTLDKDITQWSGYDLLGEYQDPANWDNFSVSDFNFLWLGGAVWIFRLKTANGFIVAHQFNYAGTAQDVFMSSPNQPVRYEIRSTTGTGSLRYICSEVSTEGSIEESGQSLALVGTKIDADVVGTIYAMIGLKKQTSYRDNAVKIIDVGLSNAAITSDSGIVAIYINPTLSAPLTYANDSKIQVAYGTGQTIIAGTGRRIYAYPLGSQGGANALSKNYLSWLSSQIDNTHDEYVVAYIPTTTTQDIYPVANVMEY
jgi:hypothetical protein